MTTQAIIEKTEKYSAHNYKPLPVVLERGEGVWVYDPEGNKYLDFLSCYSAVNQGHRHPKIMETLVKQSQKITLTSRAFYNEHLGDFCEKLVRLCDMDMALPMNTGAEAVETAIKAARKWGYKVKNIPQYKAEIICCSDNFHGRTITTVSLSTEPLYREYFGPFTPGIVTVPFGDIEALKSAITPNTAAFLIEPVQGEAGVVIPPDGYLKQVREVCTENNVLMLADEIQSGFGRTGTMFACEHDGIRPDMYILGKAISGGVYPVSAVVSSEEVLGLFVPGEHGSTFGGNPLGTALAITAIDVLIEENLVKQSKELGQYFVKKLRSIESQHIEMVRGRGLFVGVVLKKSAGGARRFCEALQEQGMLCKETHDNVIRFAPPLIITKEELDWALERIEPILKDL